MRKIIIILLMSIFLEHLANAGYSGEEPLLKALTPSELEALQNQANNNSGDAQGELCERYDTHQGVPSEPSATFKWCQFGAASGNARATAILGLLYRDGRDGAPQNIPKAISLLTKAAASTDPHWRMNAMAWLGALYQYREDGVPRDHAKALEWYLKAADLGSKYAQENAFKLLAKGEDVPRDIHKAESLAEAWAANSENNMLNLAYIYQYGRNGFDKDIQKRMRWLTRAAEIGSKETVLSVAFMFSAGAKGVDQDTFQAIKFLTPLATKGDPEAQLALGRAYLRDTPGGDEKLAAHWLEKAALQNNGEASGELADLYMNGKGVPKSTRKGLQWLSKGASLGDAWAQLQLGEFYQNTNPVLAYVWLNLAAIGTVTKPMAEEQRSALAENMNQNDIDLAEQLSAAWKVGQLINHTSANTSDIKSAAPAGTESRRMNSKQSPRVLTKRATGTAFFVNKNGAAITNSHVVTDCIELRKGGSGIIFRLLASDPTNDLAVIKAQTSQNSFASFIAPTSKIRQGADVVVYGFPLSSILSSTGNITPGIISALTGLRDNSSQLQVTAPIQPGSSGSPVLSKTGEVIGVMVAKLSDAKLAAATGSVGQNINFAIKSQVVTSFLEAQHVVYDIAGGFGAARDTPALTDTAKQWTFLVECWR